MQVFNSQIQHIKVQHHNDVDSSVDISRVCVNEWHNNKYRDYESKVATPILINLRVGESVQLQADCAGVLEKIWVTITHIDEEYDDEIVGKIVSDVSDDFIDAHDLQKGDYVWFTSGNVIDYQSMDYKKLFLKKYAEFCLLEVEEPTKKAKEYCDSLRLIVYAKQQYK